MSLKVESDQNEMSKGHISFMIKTSGSDITEDTDCQNIKWQWQSHLSNSSSLSFRRLFRMLTRCPSIGVGSWATMLWPDPAWSSDDLNFFFFGGGQT